MLSSGWVALVTTYLSGPGINTGRFSLLLFGWFVFAVLWIEPRSTLLLTYILALHPFYKF